MVLVAAACGSSDGAGFRRGGGGTSGGARGGAGGAAGAAGNRWTGTVGPPSRNIDILFLIDDSSSMRLSQANLLDNFPTFITSLQSAPQGLPNIHIAVVSQDMGAGDGSIAGCDSTGGKKGIFQYTPRGLCTATNLQPGATFISNIGGQANYTGNLADVFTCIAALGENGCGFEHQFAAILRALGADGSPAPAENQGFLRPEAALAVVLVSDEDDCSAAPGVPLYDTASNQNIASVLGPPSNFRCNEFGHLCTTGGGPLMHPSRNAPANDLNALVTYDDCNSNDVEGYLLSVKNTADRLKALKTDPSLVFFTSIQGPPAPYTVHWRNPSTADRSCGAASCPWPEISHSCTAADSSFADPGVREAELAQQFGSNGLVLSICSASFAPAFDRLAQMLNRGAVGPLCLGGAVGASSSGKPDCQVTQQIGGVSQTVPACADNGAVAPCWQLQTTEICNLSATLIVNEDPNIPAAASATLTYSCAKCASLTPGFDCY